MTSLWSPLWRTLWLMAHFVMWWRHIGWWLIHITWPLYVLPLYKFHQINFSNWYASITIAYWTIMGVFQWTLTSLAPSWVWVNPNWILNLKRVPAISMFIHRLPLFETIQKSRPIFATQLVGRFELVQSVQSVACWTDKLLNCVLFNKQLIVLIEKVLVGQRAT